MAGCATRPAVLAILSSSEQEARRRVFTLYKAWFRQIPYILTRFDIKESLPVCRKKLKEEFLKHRCVNDIRIIDRLVIQGQMDLNEAVNCWMQKGHLVSTYFPDWREPKSKDFLTDFLK